MSADDGYIFGGDVTGCMSAWPDGRTCIERGYEYPCRWCRSTTPGVAGVAMVEAQPADDEEEA